MKVSVLMSLRMAAGGLVIVALVAIVSTVAFLSPDGDLRAAPLTQPAAVRGKTSGPQYDENGDLKLPADFHTWVFVGSNLGIEYREAGAPDAPAEKALNDPDRLRNFHNVYINPEAYEHYSKTGKFPEKTVLMLDIYKAEAGEPKTVVSDGRFPGKQIGVAAAVKDSARPDGAKTDWAYYEFSLEKLTAKAFPNKACYDCHLQHADVDNVWVQFYPTLRRLRANKGK